jgi:hypothetical protein
MWINGGGNRLFYQGAHNQVYSLPMFDVQALWTMKIILGKLEVAGLEEMRHDTSLWSDKYV